jgi:DNA repair exonuclease SbcCD nuclease subunit
LKLCLITDTHYGARNDSQAFHDYFSAFYGNVVFPYMESNNIGTVIHLGDAFDRRKYINYSSLKHCKQYWFDELEKRNIDVHMIVGNHDTFFKATNDVNSPDLLLGEYNNITVYSKPQEVIFDSTPILFMPWICPENEQISQQVIDRTKAQILLGHLELKGFEMHKGSVNLDHGFDSRMFSKFDFVASGHFHHKSTVGNINYLGAPYEMTWADYNDARGFHIFDTNTRELTYIVNPYRMFNKIHYDDAEKTMDQILKADYDQYAGSYVKVIVRNKNNPYWFDMMCDKIERAGVLDMQIVEDHFNLGLEDDANIVDEAEDTLTILSKYINQLDIKTDKKRLEALMKTLYNEALSANDII